MPAIKKRPASQQPSQENHRTAQNAPHAPETTNVWTLAEVAAFLRVPESAITKLAESEGIPARQIGSEWRFLKSAIQDWLGVASQPASKEQFWATHFGALAGDPYLEAVLRKSPAAKSEATSRVA